MKYVLNGNGVENTMGKILFVATVVKTHIMEFHLPYLKMFKEQGWETAVAAKNDFDDPADCVIPYCDHYYDVPFERNPLKPQNIKAFYKLKKLVDEGGYDMIHCHTPVGAMITRLAAVGARKRGTRVLYTAHGFHFYKGAPLKNWITFFPIEWACSFITDTLITINREDYACASKHMHARRIEFVPGVGVDLNKFGAQHIDKASKRREVGVPDQKVWILNVGELIPRKNQDALIRAIADIPNVHLTIAGQGGMKDELVSLIQSLHIEDKVKLLGYRNDVAELCGAADIFAFPSLQEGLSVALMEAMACGMPIVCGAIRGNVDLVDPNGCEMFDPQHICDIREALRRMLSRDWEKSGKYNADSVKRYGLSEVLEQMRRIYF